MEREKVKYAYTDIGSRLTYFRKEFIGLSQFSLAEEFKYSPKHLSFVETGRSMPSQRLLTKYSKKYRLNQEWAITGRGNPKSTASHDHIDSLISRISVLEQQVRYLQQTIDRLSEKVKQ